LADFDLPEMKMFAKWYSTPDLVHNQAFWADCLAAYVDKSVTLPMYDEPAERAAVLKLVECPPGKCGACCRYDRVAINREDYARLSAFVNRPVDVLTDGSGKMYLPSAGGCQFLRNNACTVYAVRPAVCAAFPIIQPKDAVSSEGTSLKQLQIKIKCGPALEAVKTIFTRVCASGKLLVLPDLSLIPAYENGKGVLGPI
jgi:Fe-S-cluster containining protein